MYSHIMITILLLLFDNYYAFQFIPRLRTTQRTHTTPFMALDSYLIQKLDSIKRSVSH